jgi:hypothetical protein
MTTSNSRQTIWLDQGVYCLTRSDRGPQPSTVGIGSSDDGVTIIGFKRNKILEQGSAILIEVKEAGSIIVTTETNQTPPNLGIIKLSDHQQVATAQELPRPEIMIHAQGVGDLGGKIGDWIGTKGSGRWVEGFGLAPQTIPDTDIEYCAMLGEDWLSPWIDGGNFCGSRGMGLPLLGFSIKLKGEASGCNRLTYAASFVDGSAVGPLAEGETLSAPSGSPLEAIRVTIEPIE